jgi:CheY-like chemotaxis protein
MAEYARLRVSDNGAGISADILKRIFDPFFTTKGRGRGTGLGLAVVHGVVESHGGACSVETVPGRGTAFSVYLPLTSAPAADARPAFHGDSLAGTERILVVDDEADIVDMLVIGLERLGYDVVGVNDPIEALNAFVEDPSAWDAVITDQVMPGMLGTELLSKLKTVRSDLKTVLCTGFADQAEPANSRDIDSFLRKPTDADAVAHSLRKLFDRALVS